MITQEQNYNYELPHEEIHATSKKNRVRHGKTNFGDIRMFHAKTDPIIQNYEGPEGGGYSTVHPKEIEPVDTQQDYELYQ